MATREELLLIAKLRNEASRPLKDIQGDLDKMVDTLRDGEAPTRAQEKALRDLGREAKRTSREAQDLARKWQDVGARMTTFISLPIVAGLGMATKAASELQQAVGGTEAVFGKSAQTISAWAKTAAQSTGLSERAAREMTSQIGGLLQGFGFQQDEAAKKAIELTQLGADLGATFGTTTVDAVAALGSVLKGEFNPIERYGVALNQTLVNAKAVEMGLAATTNEVDLQARALASLAIVTENTSGAQGQFGREAGTAAGAIERAKAEIENAAAAIGEDLLPLVAQVANGISDLSSMFAGLPGPVKTAILVMGGIAAVAGPVVYLIGRWRLLQLQIEQAAIAQGRFAAGSAGLMGRGRIARGALAGGGLLMGGAMLAGQFQGGGSGFLDDLMTVGSGALTGASIGSFFPGAGTAIGAVVGTGVGLVGQFLSSGGMKGRLREAIVAHAVDGAQAAVAEVSTAIQGSFGQMAAVSAAQAAVDDVTRAFEDLEYAVDQSRGAYDLFIGRFATLDEQRLRHRQAINQFAERITQSRQKDGKPLTGDDQLDFFLDRLQAIPGIVASEQLAGELAEGAIAARQRELELVGELVETFPMLADEAEDYQSRLKDAIDDANVGYEKMLRLLAEVQIQSRIMSISATIGAITPGLSAAGDTTRPIGWDGASSSLADTLSFHRQIDALVPGSRVLSNVLVGGGGKGYGSGDHQAGRAVDVVGSNLAAYQAMAQRMGAFAEVHGQGGGKHLHVVPRPAGGKPSVSVGQIVINADRGSDVAGIERAVRRSLRDIQRDASERR